MWGHCQRSCHLMTLKVIQCGTYNVVRTMSVILSCGDTVGDLVHVGTLSTTLPGDDTKSNLEWDLQSARNNVSDLVMW